MDNCRYNCPRCLYATNHTSNYMRHLDSKSPCKPLHSNISIDDIIALLHPVKKHKCNQCDKSYNHAQGLSKHKRSCKKTKSITIEEKSPTHEVDDTQKHNNHTVNDTPPKVKKGVLYLASSSIVVGIKLGYWRADLTVLYDRYKTYYGTDLEFYLFHCQDCRLLEAIAKTIFKPYNLSLELYSQDHLQYYIQILSHLCAISQEDLKNATTITNPQNLIGANKKTIEPLHVFPCQKVSE